MLTESVRLEQQEWSRRWAGIAGRLADLLACLAAVALIAFIVIVAVLPLFGYQTLAIHGGSMAPAIGRGSLVVNRPVDPDTLAVRDVITFRRNETSPQVTHRIVSVREEGGRRFFTVQGDANGAPDPGEMSFTSEVDKAVFDVPYAGFFATFARTVQGMVILVLLPTIGLAMVLVLERG